MKEIIIEEKMLGGVYAQEVRGEIVRCKDCKHWSAERINDFNKCRRWIKVGVKNFATVGDWFCADGERREHDDPH